ncbi:FERM and PDZ domain-containing protein 4-like [Sycon ciliatum]|uniref:FERM and PDZ domain-containing protein 4-like n=1 Tax=Sycon ciliatum TaxID=27933 RepID=UPI0020A857D9|eukprot:scpid31584/ scgid4882/ FERM and PDZ domain-containing protein 4; PDZ domain-containing protein 10; PSD-95-interacting regulator of spine morphogenesis
MENETKPPEISSDKTKELDILTIGLSTGWAVRLVESEGKKTNRLHYVNHVKRSAQWLPPPEFWKCPNLLPYGWELGIDDDGHVYYINHLNEITTRRDPRVQATLDDQDTRKEFLLEKKDSDEDFGFTLSDSPPYVVTSVAPGGAASSSLSANDVISRVGHVEVFELSKDEVSDLLKEATHTGTVKIQVMNSEVSGPQNESLPTQTQDGKLATHLLPGVLLVDLMTGGSRKFRITRTTTAQDIVDNVCKRLDITTPEMFGLYIETVTPERSSLRILYGWQLLAKLPQEIIDSMVANDIEAGEPRPENDRSHIVRIVCRLRFLPGSIDDLYDVDRRAFEYFFHQTSLDVANDRFSSECPNDVALLLGSLSIAHFCMKQGKKKVSLKEVEKTVGGLQPFFPTSILDRLKTADLRKHVKKALDTQDIDMEQPNATDLQLKYLSLLAEFPSLAGEKFKCMDEVNNQEITLLVSPQNGFGSIDSPLEAGWCSEVQITTFCSFDGLESIKVEELEVPTEKATTRVIISFEDSDIEPHKYQMSKEAAREIGHLLQGYAQLLAKVELALDDPVLLIDTKLETDKSPPYRSLHHVATTNWSYFDGAWETYLQTMNKSESAAISQNNSCRLNFPVGKILVEKASLYEYMAVDLSQKLSYGKRKKKRVIYLRKTGADLARDFLNRPEPLDVEEQEDFTAHLCSRQMVSTAVTTEETAESSEDTASAPPKKSAGAAAALAALLGRSKPVVDESEGLATAQPLRGIVASSDFGNSMSFNESSNDTASTAPDPGWGGSATVEITPAADPPGTAPPDAAGWGNEDEASAKQPSLSDFGVSVRSTPQGFGFGAGGNEEDEIAGW